MAWDVEGWVDGGHGQGAVMAKELDASNAAVDAVISIQ
jgi:hypothetical protein